MVSSLKNKKADSLTTGSVGKALVLFALPLLGSSLIQQLYNMVDLLFVGNVLGKGASAAVGSSSLLVTCLVGFFTGLSVGSGVIIARFYGGKDRSNLQEAVHTAMGVSLLGGIVLMLAGLILCPWVLQWMQVPAHLLEDSVTYLRIYFFSMLPLILYNMGSGILRAAGDAKRPMIYLAFGGVCNIVLDWLFLTVFPWGIAGVAWATVLSQSLSAGMVFWHLLRTKKEYRVTLRKIRIHKRKLAMILRIGLPAGFQSMLLTFSNMAVQYHINGFGENAMAAFSSYFKIENFMYLPILAFGQAMTTFAGQNVGAGQMDRVRKGVKLCLLLSMGTTVVTSSGVLLCGRWLFGLFNPVEEVIACGLQIIFVTAPLYLLYPIQETLSAVLQGTGKAIVPMIICLGNLCGLRILLLWLLLSVWHTVPALAAVYPITWACSAICLLLYYWFGRWMGLPEKQKSFPFASFLKNRISSE